MRILLLAHSFNSLTQRLWVELAALGHELSLELDVSDALTADAVRRFAPDLVLAPFLKRAIAEDVWRSVRCLVIHPGIVGDRGPSALDWAVQDGETDWGATVLQANAVMDAGDIWATAEFPMRAASKGSLYRNEVTEAAVTAVRAALERIAAGTAPTSLLQWVGSRGRQRPLMRQADRAIDWHHETTDVVLRKLRAADGVPGVLDRILDVDVHCYDAHPERLLRGPPGEVIAQRHQAICRATVDGSVWITHLKAVADAERPFKLPSAMVLRERLDGVPEIAAPAGAATDSTWSDLWYEEHGHVGVLHFPFYNGAMSTLQCERLTAAYRAACRRPTRVIVLAGGRDFWSNGIHLNVIEASAQPAEESLRNIDAIDDLALAILETEIAPDDRSAAGQRRRWRCFPCARRRPRHRAPGHRAESALQGHGEPLRFGVLDLSAAAAPRRGGCARSDRGSPADGRGDGAATRPDRRLLRHDRRRSSCVKSSKTPRRLAVEDFADRMAEKRERRADDEARKPLAAYRAEEMEKMRLNFFGFDSSYHVARYNFVRKVPKSRTPSYLARHRAPQPVRA